MPEISIDIPTDVYRALHRFALQERLTQEEAALLIMRDWLIGNGYIDPEAEIDEDTPTQGEA